MKETIEQAAKEYADGLRSVDKKSTYDNIEVDSARMVAFKRGAEWQAQQSPWISVWVRKPKDGERVWVRCKRFNNLPFFYSAGKFHTTLKGGYCAKDVTHWMPIPE